MIIVYSFLSICLAFSSTHCQYHLHLRSASTGKAHELAANTAITVPAPSPEYMNDIHREVELTICNSVFAFRAGGFFYWEESEVWIWDWRKGRWWPFGSEAVKRKAMISCK